MSDRSFELRLLRQEISAVRVLLERLEVRVAVLEEEDRFEVVYHEAPASPSDFPGSGGVNLSRGTSGNPSPLRSGSGGVELTRASSSSHQPGSGGGQLSQAYSSASSLPSDGSCAAHPGGPSSSFRTEVSEGVGRFLRRALDGAYRGSSGRDQLSLASRYYIVPADFEGRQFAEPCVFSSFTRAKSLCIRGPDKGNSIFVGLPSQTEVASALRAAGLSWPRAGLDGQPAYV